jgi:hypothetical protein
MQAGERPVRDHPLQHFDRVVPDDAQILQFQRVDFLQQAADAGAMHLDGDVIRVRIRLGDYRRGLAMPEPISSTTGAVLPKIPLASTR